MLTARHRQNKRQPIMIRPRCLRTPVLAFLAACLAAPGAFAASSSASPPGSEQYLQLHPAFVVNLQGSGRAHYMQATAQLKSDDPECLQAAKAHDPAIRHRLILLFSERTVEEMSTVEGKEELRAEALTAVNEILRRETGRGGIEAVYFSSLVIQ